MILKHNRVIIAIRKHIIPSQSLTSRDIPIRIQEPTSIRIIVSGIEVVESSLGIVEVAAVAQGIELSQDCVLVAYGQNIAPGIVGINSHRVTGGAEKRGHIALEIGDGIVRRSSGLQVAFVLCAVV